LSHCTCKLQVAGLWPAQANAAFLNCNVAAVESNEYR
jgi:hypothetical protein